MRKNLKRLLIVAVVVVCAIMSAIFAQAHMMGGFINRHAREGGGAGAGVDATFEDHTAATWEDHTNADFEDHTI